MLTRTSFGLRAEQFVERLFQAARIRSCGSIFSADVLLNSAKTVDPRRYQTCNSQVKLNRCNASELLDRLYGVDHVIDLGEDVYVSVDTTVSPAAVAKKMRKALELSKLRSAVGIHQHFVVMVVGDIDNPNANVMAKSINDLWNALCEAANGPANRVRSFRLHIS